MLAPPNVVVIARKVAAQYGLNDCRACAADLRRAFKARGMQGHVLRLSTVGGRGWIVMKDPAFRLPFHAPPNVAIAESGQHFGVEVGQHVFDNIFRDGILKSEWEGKFDCDVHRFKLDRIESF